jgi:hypothetical protein
MGSGEGPGGSLEGFFWLILYFGMRNLRRKRRENVKTSR